jgi:hypothetical protein
VRSAAGYHQILDVDSSAGKDHTSSVILAGVWDVHYSWDCTHQQQEKKAGADGAIFEVYNTSDDTLAAENPQTTGKGRSGGGVLHFKRAGDYYVAVTSVCDWHVSVDDLSAS